MTAEAFAIAVVTLDGGGSIGLCPMPGRGGDLAGDLETVAAFAPAVVVTLTEGKELAAHGAEDLPQRLAARGITHRHFPVVDYGAPEAGDTAWPALAAELHGALASGHRVLVHCMGGCGRSGMVALRLLVERGEAAEAALARLRAVRPCAVETAWQVAWAARQLSRRGAA
jgi:protein-tyrosine phosphatase